MTVLPAIVRELRAQGRLPFTYGLRVLGAAALLLVSLFFALESGIVPDDGGRLFGWLNFTLFVFIWVVVPLIAADCISRERREGTIGLLFLTPLKAREIVVAKGLVHGLRALSLWFAVIPVLAIPFLMGGLGRRELALSFLFNFSSICLTLAAGLLASAVSKNWLRAQILACILSFGLACVFIGLTGYLFEYSVAFKANAYSYVGGSPLIRTSGGTIYMTHFASALAGPSFQYGAASYQYLAINRDTLPLVGFFCVSDYHACWSPMLAALSAAGQSSWLSTAGGLAVLSLFSLLAAVELAARRLRRIWQEQPPSARQLWLEEVLCAPVIGVTFLRWWMRRKLEHNPIGWLEQRSWSGRLVMWGWLAVMVSLYCTFLTGSYALQIVHRLQHIMAWLLLIGLAASAAGSFQRERESGVMELLLVSPVSEARIIGGRVRGLWGQFLPALLLLLAAWAYINSWSHERPDGFAWIQFYCVAFLTLPVIGLYHSLRWKSFITAFLMTFVTGLMLPLLPLVLMLRLQRILYNMYQQLGVRASVEDLPGHVGHFVSLNFWDLFPNLLQVVIAVLIARRLYRDLRHRNFAFSRTVT
jgi:ABC-type transport system involved in multi-copper enzyme maturation permease subunit